MNKQLTAAVLLSVMALGGCGGGGSATAPPVDNNIVPASALTSTAAFSGYVVALVADDQAEPKDVEGIVPPTSENEEPVDVG